jgi:DnaK suppressor protein
MSKRKATPQRNKKAAPAKSSKPAGALKKLARKAAGLVSSGRTKSPKPASRNSAAARKPATRPRAVAAQPVKPTRALLAAGSDTSPISFGGGRLPSEAEIRRMADSAYMNDVQLEFFRQRLLQMRAEVVERELDVKERLHQRESFADPADRATAEEEHWLDLRLRERESLLLRKIDDALRRIRDREYGYCEVTGEPIGIPRLLARPTATVCVDVKGQTEQIESQFRDR